MDHGLYRSTTAMLEELERELRLSGSLSSDKQEWLEQLRAQRDRLSHMGFEEAPPQAPEPDDISKMV